jgi:signal transduction histidine kinase
MRGSASDHVQSTPLVLPSTGAERFARHLSASGFHPVIEVDRSADDLDATTMRTLGRIMQEATTNIVRYAPAGSACRYALDVAEDRVRLTVLSSMPVQDRRSMLSLGWGLRGIAERVALSHGSFTAGPRRGDWLVDVTLPLDRTDARPAAALAG